MNRKMLAKFCVAAFALTGFNAAFACGTTAWTGGVTGAPVAGKPGTGDGDPDIRRYANLCGLQAPASGAFVTDDLPAAETAYQVRFYAFPSFTAGEGAIFEALGAANEQRIRVTHDGTNFRFYTSGTTAGGAAAVPAASNRWYSILLSWTAGGNLTYTVQGAASSTPQGTGNVAGATGTIERARLGFVGGQGGAATGAVTVDALDSRRASVPPRLCRGDANNDGVYGVQDRIAMTNEILLLQNGDTTRSLANGQPDATEDGIVSVNDRIAVTNFITAVPALTCSNT